MLAPVLVAAAAIGFSGQASAVVDLPNKSASQILAMINTNPDISFSGTVIKRAAMGLPPMNIIPDISQSMVDSMSKNMPKEMVDFIPKASAQGELALALEFLAGTHKAHLYVDGTSKVRVQVLDLLSERDFIRNGADIWFYDAGKSLVKHSVINPADEAQVRSEADNFFNTNESKLPFDVSSPAQVADYVIKQAGPYATFTVGSDARVAGRGVYQLTMTPQSTTSLVRSATISVDALTGLPLAVAINAVGQNEPAFEVTFETVTFETPAPALFAFTPPVGATVQEVAVPTQQDLMKYTSKAPSPTDEKEAVAQLEKLREQGWSAVLEIPADKVPAQFSAGIKDNKLFTELTKPVAGGRVFTTALLNIFIADDGRIFVGSVTTQRLLEVAAQ